MEQQVRSEPPPGPMRSIAGSALAHDIEFLALKAFARGTRVFNEHLRPLDLRARSYSVLALACAPRPLTQRELATLLELDPSQIVALVDDLAGRGLVSRERDPRDQRTRLVTATAAGHALFDEALEVATTAEDTSLDVLSTQERDQLRGLLRKIVFRR